MSTPSTAAERNPTSNPVEPAAPPPVQQPHERILGQVRSFERHLKRKPEVAAEHSSRINPLPANSVKGKVEQAPSAAFYAGVETTGLTLAEKLHAGNVTLDDLYRGYKHTPHAPISMFLKYLVHRVNHLDAYDDPSTAHNLDQQFIGLTGMGDAGKKNGHVNAADLHDWTRKLGSKVIPDLIANRDNLQREVVRGVGMNVRDIGGEKYVALTRGLKSDIMNREHSLSSWADIQEPPFGDHKHHAWVPVKDLWFSYDHHNDRYPSGNHGAEDEWLVSNTGPRYEASKEDVKSSRLKHDWHRWSGVLKDWAQHTPTLHTEHHPWAPKSFYFDDATDDELAQGLMTGGMALDDSRVRDFVTHKGAGPRTLEVAHRLNERMNEAPQGSRPAFPPGWLASPAITREQALPAAQQFLATNPHVEQMFAIANAVKNPHYTTEDLRSLSQFLPAGKDSARIATYALLNHPAADSSVAEAAWQKVERDGLPPGALLSSALTPAARLDPWIQHALQTSKVAVEKNQPAWMQDAQDIATLIVQNPNHTEAQAEALVPVLMNSHGLKHAEIHPRWTPAALQHFIARRDSDMQETWASQKHNSKNFIGATLLHNPNVSDDTLLWLMKQGKYSPDMLGERKVRLSPRVQQAFIEHLAMRANAKGEGQVENEMAWKALARRADLAPETVQMMALAPNIKNGALSALFLNKRVSPKVLRSVWPEGLGLKPEDVAGGWTPETALKAGKHVSDRLVMLAKAIVDREAYEKRKQAEHLIKAWPQGLAKSDKLWSAHIRSWLADVKRSKQAPGYYYATDTDEAARIMREGFIMPKLTDEVLDGQVVWAHPAKDHHLHAWEEQQKPGDALLYFETDDQPQQHDDGRVYWPDVVQTKDAGMVAIAPLNKAHGPVSFPKLGVPDDRRSVKLVNSNKQLRTVARAMASAQMEAAHAKTNVVMGPDQKAATLTALEERAGGSLGAQSAVNPNLAYSISGKMRHANAEAIGEDAGDPNTEPKASKVGNAQFGTALHESLHQMLLRVGKKHGMQARKNLAQNLYLAIPRQYRDAVDVYAHHRRGDMDVHEERLASMLNFLNNPHDRQEFFAHKNWQRSLHFDEGQEAFEAKMKRAHRSLEAIAPMVDEKWLRFSPPWQAWEPMPHEVLAEQQRLRDVIYNPRGATVKKGMPTPKFPGIGVTDDRRSVKVINTPGQKRTILHAVANATARGDDNWEKLDPQQKESALSRERMMQGPAYGLQAGANPDMAYALSAGRRHALAQDFGHPSDPSTEQHSRVGNAQFGTELHEGFHAMLNRVGQKHGVPARRALAEKLHQAIPSQYRAAVDAFAEKRYGPSVHAEERLANILTFLNSPTDRKNFFASPSWEEGPHAAAGENAFSTSMKRAYRALQAAAGVAHPGWLGKGEETEESPPALNLPGRDLEPGEHETAMAMLGHNATHEKALAAAHFLVGRKQPVDHDKFRMALALYGDHERAALYAVGLSEHPKNLRALRGAVSLGSFAKAETGDTVISIHSVQPGNEDALDTTEAVQRAVTAGMLQALNLNGKHSKGAMAARDPKTGYVYLLKPGSGKQSPAAGARDDRASQSRREACFFHVADLVGLGKFFPHADLVLVSAQEWAVMRLLGSQFKSLDEKNQQKDQYAREVLQPYLESTVIHRWAIIDWVLGNTDRHGQNVMVSPGGSVALIDHGAAFAGENFDPAHDDKSFIPYYLRAWAPEDDFKVYEPDERVRYMPRLTPEQDKALVSWLNDIEPVQVERLIAKYGIDPKPSMARLAQVQSLAGGKSLSEGVNRLWAGVEAPATKVAE